MADDKAEKKQLLAIKQNDEKERRRRQKRGEMSQNFHYVCNDCHMKIMYPQPQFLMALDCCWGLFFRCPLLPLASFCRIYSVCLVIAVHTFGLSQLPPYSSPLRLENRDSFSCWVVCTGCHHNNKYAIVI